MGDGKNWSIWSSGLFGHLVYLVVWSIWSSGLFGLSSHFVYKNRPWAIGYRHLAMGNGKERSLWSSGLSGHLVKESEKNRKG